MTQLITVTCCGATLTVDAHAPSTCSVCALDLREAPRQLPDIPFYRQLAAGHRNRTGHELVATLVTEDNGVTWSMARSCCVGA